MARVDRERSASKASEDVSRLFRALANEHRRAVVRTLDERHTPIPRDALATYVAKEVFSERQRADFVGFRDRMLVKLHHLHLPMLAKAGVVEVESGAVVPGRAFAQAVAFLDEIH